MKQNIWYKLGWIAIIFALVSGCSESYQAAVQVRQATLIGTSLWSIIALYCFTYTSNDDGTV